MLLFLSEMVVGLSRNTTISKIKCVGGRIVRGICVCPRGVKQVNGVCIYAKAVSCRGGRIVNNICKCPPKSRYIKGGCEKIN